ncbi:MAG: hypothetical protein MI974_10580 [Chitinophagales bacterium]|nr:hypothetical protein [Chitinophagales bacterium]
MKFEIIAFLVLFGLFLWLLLSLERRVEKYIRKNARDHGLNICTIRPVYSHDGKSPFGEIDVWIGGGCNIFGIRGERTFNRIIIVDEEDGQKKYWVKIRTAFFMPAEIQWEEIN